MSCNIVLSVVDSEEEATDICFCFIPTEFSSLLVPLIFSRKRGRFYHGDRRSWHRSENMLPEETTHESSNLNEFESSL